MGVPRLYPWTIKNFGEAITRFQQGEYSNLVDYLYLDGNSFLHSAAQKIFNYGDNKRKMDPYRNLSESVRRKKVFSLFFEIIIQITQMAPPRKVLYIAIDGPAPLAKQNQQRERRFSRSIDILKEESESGKDHFDSANLTPGTVFMLELTRYMNYAIRKEMNSYGSWKNIEVYFSPATNPGEGEHKCLEFIRELPAIEREKSTHCMYGNDGDLIMLGLSSHVQNMYLLREGFNAGQYDFLDIGIIRKNITKYLPFPVKNKPRNYNDIVDDFIVLGFFVGNDFLPKIQMFHLGNLLNEPLDYMIKTYNRTSKGVSNFLVTDGKLDLSGFKVFVNEITRNEEKFLINQFVKPPKPREEPVEIFKNVTLAECITTSIPAGSDNIVYHLNMEKYRQRYYQKCGILNPNSLKENPLNLPKDIKDKRFKDYLKGMCHDYLRTLIWVFQYYVHGLPSWRWAYEHHYAPLMVDFNDYLQSLTSKEYEKLYTFDIQSPSLPFEQLLSVLPPTSADLLPDPYRKLMTNPQSPLVKLGYYPRNFEVDYEAKIKKHEGIVILPFVDYNEIHKYYIKMTKCCVKDPKKFVRNILSRTSIFRYDKNYTATFTSDMGNIDHLHVRKTFV